MAGRFGQQLERLVVPAMVLGHNHTAGRIDHGQGGHCSFQVSVQLLHGLDPDCKTEGTACHLRERGCCVNDFVSEYACCGSEKYRTA